MDRRGFLVASGAAALAGSTRVSLAATGNNGGSGRPRFLLVFLRGGYDALNVVAPTSAPLYQELRPHIALPKPDAGLETAVALDADWSLHPSLRDSIHPLYTRGQVAFIPCAGTDDASRSHFETQDTIELGQRPGASRTGAGFLNRLAAALSGSEAIAFGAQVPLALQGPRIVANVALQSLARPGIDARQASLITAMYAPTPLAGAVRDGFGVRDEVMRDFADEMESAGRGAVSSKGFEAEARRIARMMRERYDLGMVDIGGWDTHVGEGGATGYLANRIDELGRGLAAFADAMGPDWSRTVVYVLSEFGRTFAENGNRGTDHGHGSVHWVMGGSVRGGRIAGEQVRLARETLFQGRDLPVLNEYRGVLAGLFGRIHGLDRSALAGVFPGAEPKDLGLA